MGRKHDKTRAPATLCDALVHFADEAKCFEFIVRMRWTAGVVCPRCHCTAHSFISTRRIWSCKGCKRHFSVKVGTIMEDSPLPLGKWLAAIWLLSNAKNGISSYELHRAIGVTQKTAWFLLHRIRHTMEQGTLARAPGTFEVDETYVGGKAKNMHTKRKKEKIKGRGSSGKTAVLGILERGEPRTKEQRRRREGRHSNVTAKPVPDTQSPTLQAEVLRHVPKGSRLYSDEHPSYPGLKGYHQESVNHAAKEYVRDDVHTNGIENFWSLFKRCIHGTYISVSPKHLERYVTEEVFRFNSREHNDSERFKLAAGCLTGKRLTYKRLIATPE